MITKYGNKNKSLARDLEDKTTFENENWARSLIV